MLWIFEICLNLYRRARANDSSRLFVAFRTSQQHAEEERDESLAVARRPETDATRDEERGAEVGERDGGQPAVEEGQGPTAGR